MPKRAPNGRNHQCRSTPPSTFKALKLWPPAPRPAQAVFCNIQPNVALMPARPDAHTRRHEAPRIMQFLHYEPPREIHGQVINFHALACRIAGVGRPRAWLPATAFPSPPRWTTVPFRRSRDPERVADAQVAHPSWRRELAEKTELELAATAAAAGAHNYSTAFVHEVCMLFFVYIYLDYNMASKSNTHSRRHPKLYKIVIRA